MAALPVSFHIRDSTVHNRIVVKCLTPPKVMLLEKLSNARGVSGNETEVRALIIQSIRERVDEYRVDSMGNLIVLKRAFAPAKRRGTAKVMVAAHMDEVGLLIVHVENDGRLRFERVGGIDNRVLPSQVFFIGENKVPGVIGVKPIHKSSSADIEKAIKAEDLTLDIGAKSKDDALEAVKIGDYASFATEFTRIGEGLVRGKALDDRTGCALLVELLAADYPFDLYGVFTVQEEIGSRGARVVAYSVEPEVAFVLESTVCDDSPKEKDVSPTTRLGYGPALTVADRSLIADKRLVKLVTAAARENGLLLQIKQPLIGSTDAGRLHLTREGVPSVAVAVPTRYIHSPAAMLSLRDFDNTLLLMRKTLLKLPRHLHE
jgi:putative aminopeptidase FrvX